MLPGPVIPKAEKQGAGAGRVDNGTPSICPSAWASGPAGRGGSLMVTGGRDVEGQRAPERQAFPQPLKFIVATDSD